MILKKIHGDKMNDKKKSQWRELRRPLEQSALRQTIINLDAHALFNNLPRRNYHNEILTILVWRLRVNVIY